MSKKSHIKKSIYNQGKYDIDHIIPAEVKLDDLWTDKYRLEKVLRLLKTYERIRPASCQTKVFVTAEDFLNTPHSRSKQGCQISFDSVFDNLFLTHSNYGHIHGIRNLDSYANSKHLTRPNERIEAISQELRSLKQDLKKKFNKEILQKVRELVQELHLIISFAHSKQRKHVNRLRVSFSRSVIRDIRNLFRQTVHLIFKNLSDFSGCEEEARFTSIVNRKPLFLTINEKNNAVQHRIFN